MTRLVLALLLLAAPAFAQEPPRERTSFDEYVDRIKLGRDNAERELAVRIIEIEKLKRELDALKAKSDKPEAPKK